MPHKDGKVRRVVTVLQARHHHNHAPPCHARQAISWTADDGAKGQRRAPSSELPVLRSPEADSWPLSTSLHLCGRRPAGQPAKRPLAADTEAVAALCEGKHAPGSGWKKRTPASPLSPHVPPTMPARAVRPNSSPAAIPTPRTLDCWRTHSRTEDERRDKLVRRDKAHTKQCSSLSWSLSLCLPWLPRLRAAARARGEWVQGASVGGALDR